MRFFLCLLIVVTALCSVSAAAQFYDIDPAESDVRILVYRGGLLKGLGHNHIVSVEEISGAILLGPTPMESAIQLRFPVASLVVDDADQRREEGSNFSAEVSQKDKEGTSKNLLGRKLLDAANFLEIRIVSSRVRGEWPDLIVDAEVYVRNQVHNVSFPVSVEFKNDQLIAGGEVVVTHADIGLKPFKAAFGTLRVRDKMLLRYLIVADRTE